MSASYQVVARKDKEGIAALLAWDGQGVLELVDLLTEARQAVDELVRVVGQRTVERVLELSAREVAGPKHQGQRGGEVR